MVKERSDNRKPVGSNDKEKIRTKSDRYRWGFMRAFLVFLTDVMTEVFWYCAVYLCTTNFDIDMSYSKKNS